MHSAASNTCLDRHMHVNVQIDQSPERDKTASCLGPTDVVLYILTICMSLLYLRLDVGGSFVSTYKLHYTIAVA